MAEDGFQKFICTPKIKFFKEFSSPSPSPQSDKNTEKNVGLIKSATARFPQIITPFAAKSEF